MSRIRELVLRSDVLEIVLLPELGARIHRLRAHGVDLLRTPADPAVHGDDPFFWGSYLMAPWCNRAPVTPIDVAGRSVRLSANFPDGSAIHGLVFARPWEEMDGGLLRATMPEGEDGWPWAYEVTARVAVDGPTASLRYELVNRSGVPMPGGIGLHPWFVGPVALTVPGEAVYPRNTASPPVPEPVDGRFDLRVPRDPEPGVDATWTRLSRPAVDLAWADRGVAARIEFGAGPALVAVAAPVELDAVAVEPQTHGPDGLRRLVGGEPDPLALLEPGGVLALALRITVRRAFADDAATVSPD
jgi:aldose 1-epimerase